MPNIFVMYDTERLQVRMAELGLNFYQLAKRAKVDPKTAKRIVLEGTGYTSSITAVFGALGFTFPDLVKRKPEQKHRDSKRRSA